MMLAIVPAIVVVAIAYGRFMKRFSKQYQEALAKASEVAQEGAGRERNGVCS
jgi:uncharacterized BrkB/YihY/UPF0761 family membrane protein